MNWTRRLYSQTLPPDLYGALVIMPNGLSGASLKIAAAKIDFSARLETALTCVPGLIFLGALVGLAFLLRTFSVFAILSPMILATILGMLFRNIAEVPAWTKPGIAFGLRRLLRLGIVLLGLQLGASQIVQVGLSGVVIIAIVVASTFAFTKWLGARLAVDEKLAELIGAGTSICGASAIIATNTVTRGADEDVTYAMACITVLGSCAMFIYPLLAISLHLSPERFGLWAGSSIHEVAQVIGAAFQDGPEAGQAGTVAKLTRVLMLAPFVMTLGFIGSLRSRKGEALERNAPPVPWFLLGFLFFVILNSFIVIPASFMTVIVAITTILLSMALAAMGLETDFRKLQLKGFRPFCLAVASWLFIASVSLALLEVTALLE